VKLAARAAGRALSAALGVAVCTLSACHQSKGAEVTAQTSEPVASSAPSNLGAQTGAGPFRKFRLQGARLGDSGIQTPWKFELTWNAGEWQGQAREGDAEALSVLDAKLTLIGSSIGVSIYRLTYAVDVCEHAQPSKAEPVPWRYDRCFYVQANSKPKFTLNAEMRLNIRTLGVVRITEGSAYQVAAVGNPDLVGLTAANVSSGLVFLNEVGSGP
jgi:hypothetical protein